MKYSVIDIANFFIKQPLSLIKLQKLVYISYGWYWALLQKELFEDEIQAWDNGPVIPIVYFAFKKEGYPINVKIPFNDEELIDNPKTILEVVNKSYSDVPSGTIARITHAPGTPWSSIYDGTRNKEIPKSLIHRYYELLYDAKRTSKFRS